MSCGRTFDVGRTVSRGQKTDVDLIRHLSERAKAERAPGQTLQSKMNELRREAEAVG